MNSVETALEEEGKSYTFFLEEEQGGGGGARGPRPRGPRGAPERGREGRQAVWGHGASGRVRAPLVPLSPRGSAYNNTYLFSLK